MSKIRLGSSAVVVCVLCFASGAKAQYDGWRRQAAGNSVGDARLYTGPYQYAFRYALPPLISFTDWAYGFLKEECGDFAGTTYGIMVGVSHMQSRSCPWPFPCVTIRHVAILCSTSVEAI